MAKCKPFQTRIMIMIPGKGPKTTTIEWDPNLTWDEQLAPYLGPNVWTEHVHVRYEGRIRDMFVDENGKMKNLPPNRLASDIYGGVSGIAGPAVLFLDHKVWK